MDNTDEMMRLQHRGMLPAGFEKLVEAVGLDDVSDEALKEVRDVVSLTEGQALINRMIAKVLTTVLATEELASLEQRQRDADAAAQDPANQQTNLPESEEEKAARFAAWLETEKQLTLDEFGALSEPERAILEDEFGKIEPPKIDPLDHDGDGEKGGSKKGNESTAAKGARRRSASGKPKPKAKGARTRKPKAAAAQA